MFESVIAPIFSLLPGKDIPFLQRPTFVGRKKECVAAAINSTYVFAASKSMGIEDNTED